MPTTDLARAKELQDHYPEAFAALQPLVLSMADLATRPSPGAAAKFQSSLKSTLMALEADYVVAPAAAPSAYREALVELLGKFKLAFPNWQDAYAFADEFFGNTAAADERIAASLVR